MHGKQKMASLAACCVTQHAGLVEWASVLVEWMDACHMATRLLVFLLPWLYGVMYPRVLQPRRARPTTVALAGASMEPQGASYHPGGKAPGTSYSAQFPTVSAHCMHVCWVRL
jgi:hypothetical protein